MFGFEEIIHGPVYLGMRYSTAFIMTGIGFTFGIFLGLLIQLPVITLPSGDREIQNDISEIMKRKVEVKNENNNRQFGIESVKSDLKNLEALGTVRKQLSFSKPLSGLKPSLHGVVYPQNNKSNTYLLNQQEKTANPSKSLPNQGNTNHNRNPHLADKGDFLRPEDNVPNGLGRDNEPRGSKSGFKNIVNGIFWSKKLESKCPTGFTDKIQKDWINKIQEMKFLKMEEGCGRMQNRFLTFKDASKACARYRINTDQIQGEIYSFYLGKLLKINNMPPTGLTLVNYKDDQWRTVHGELANAQWADDKVVILTKWVDSLKPAYIPFEFRENDRKLHPDFESLSVKGHKDMCDLVQWSDLIVFDYLTANLDRVVNNMFNKQWNPNMMNSPAHNLERDPDGSLIFFDNESGLFHGYRLLDKYSSYHKSLLNSLCVFRNSTASVIERLYLSGNIGEEVHNLFIQNEPLHRYVPKIPKKNIKILQQRLSDVYNQIQQCRTKFS